MQFYIRYRYVTWKISVPTVEMKLILFSFIYMIFLFDVISLASCFGRSREMSREVILLTCAKRAYLRHVARDNMDNYQFVTVVKYCTSVHVVD